MLVDLVYSISMYFTSRAELSESFRYLIGYLLLGRLKLGYLSKVVVEECSGQLFILLSTTVSCFFLLTTLVNEKRYHVCYI